MWDSGSCDVVSVHPPAEELPGAAGAQLRYGWSYNWVTLLSKVGGPQTLPPTRWVCTAQPFLVSLAALTAPSPA